MRCCQNFCRESTLPMPTSWKTCSMTSGKGVCPRRASLSTAKRSSLVNLRQYSCAMSVSVSRTLSLAHSKPVCARMVAIDWYSSCRQEDQLSSVTGSPFPLKNSKDKNSTLSKPWRTVSVEAMLSITRRCTKGKQGLWVLHSFSVTYLPNRCLSAFPSSPPPPNQHFQVAFSLLMPQDSLGDSWMWEVDLLNPYASPFPPKSFSPGDVN